MEILFNQGSMKELYDCFLKTTYDIEMGGKIFEVGEVIAKFDKIQIAGLQEMRQLITANGGFDNRAHVFWDSTKEIDLVFTQGVFSAEQFSLATNSKLIRVDEGENIILSKQERIESNENGLIELSEKPEGKIFIYDKNTGEKIMQFSQEGKTINIDMPYKDVIINYSYTYVHGARVMKIGQRQVSGFLEFEGKTRVKDDTTGQVITGLLKIPKLKLMSDLSLRLGSQANPVAANF